MSILKKVLHLNYGEEKNQKQVIKSYNFEVAPNTEDNILKEVGEELKKIVYNILCKQKSQEKLKKRHRKKRLLGVK